MEQKDKFWTFIVDSISYSPRAMGAEFFEVVGQFVYSEITEEDRGEHGEAGHPAMLYHELTPDPVKLRIPKFFIQAEHPADVAPSDVVPILNGMFSSMPFKAIPKPPKTFPMHRVPPHRREAVSEALDSMGGF